MLHSTQPQVISLSGVVYISGYVDISFLLQLSVCYGKALGEYGFMSLRGEGCILKAVRLTATHRYFVCAQLARGLDLFSWSPHF